MEAERPALLQRFGSADIDRQEVGERAAEEGFRLALEGVGELLRNIGEGSERIRFPEPASAAALELADEMLGLARMGLELETLAAGGDEAACGRHAVREQ